MWSHVDMTCSLRGRDRERKKEKERQRERERKTERNREREPLEPSCWQHVDGRVPCLVQYRIHLNLVKDSHVFGVTNQW